MRAHLIVFAVAVIVALIGVGVLVGSTSPRTMTTTFHLLPQTAYCTYFRFAVLTGGSVTVTFAASPGSVIQYVMTESEEIAFFAGSGVNYVGVDTGANGTFTTALPSGGTYYVLSCHDAGYAGIDQSGSHTMTITGITPDSFYEGIGILVFAGVLVVVGLVLRSRPQRPAPAFAPYGTYGPTASYPGGYAAPVPYPAAPVPYPVSVLRTLHVYLENPSGTEESVQIYVNANPIATIPVPPGGKAQMDLHPNTSVPPNVPVRIDAVTRGGSRASQDVTPDATGEASVSLRVG